MNACYFLASSSHTALGRDLATQLNGLRQPPAAVQRTTTAYAQHQQELPYRLLHDQPLCDLPTRLYRVLDAVIEAALDAANLTAAERSATGLFIGSSSFDISASEALYREALETSASDSTVLALEHSSSLSNLAAYVRRRWRLRGPDYSFNTACTASANALIYADAMIRSGRLQHALVLGVEIFNSLTALGFYGLQLLTPTVMKPFDRERNGLVLGEACAALVLGTRASRPRPFQLLGGSNFCDTFGISSANPDGSSIAHVMRQALRAAQLRSEDIDAVKVHGTASLLNDEAESRGMREIFARLPAATALKPFTGHTLGACGLTECLLFCAAADQGWLTATPGIAAAENELGIRLNQAPCDLPPGRFMLNYFGFGGNNCSLIVSNLDRA